jgi:hypothetical protein
MNVETSAAVHAPRPNAFDRTRVAVPSTSPAVGSSLAGLHDLWLASWERALAALTIASQAGTLLPNDVAAHRAAIAAEREVVTRQLVLL